MGSVPHFIYFVHFLETVVAFQCYGESFKKKVACGELPVFSLSFLDLFGKADSACVVGAYISGGVKGQTVIERMGSFGGLICA